MRPFSPEAAVEAAFSIGAAGKIIAVVGSRVTEVTVAPDGVR